MSSLPELNHKQGTFNEYVYVCNMHVATYLGAITLLIVFIIALSGCIFGSFCKLKVNKASSGRRELWQGTADPKFFYTGAQTHKRGRKKNVVKLNDTWVLVRSDGVTSRNF